MLRYHQHQPENQKDAIKATNGTRTKHADWDCKIHAVYLGCLIFLHFLCRTNPYLSRIKNTFLCCLGGRGAFTTAARRLRKYPPLYGRPRSPDNERVARQDFFTGLSKRPCRSSTVGGEMSRQTVKNPVRLVNSFNLFCFTQNCVITESTHTNYIFLSKLLTSRSAKIFVLLISLAAIKKSYLFLTVSTSIDEFKIGALVATDKSLSQIFQGKEI
jgi:hypothetical protein